MIRTHVTPTSQYRRTFIAGARSRQEFSQPEEMAKPDIAYSLRDQF